MSPNRVAALVAVAGAALAAIGTTLTWYEIEIAGVVGPGGSVSGVEGSDGRTVLAAAAVATAAAIALVVGTPRLAFKLALVIAGGITTVVAVAGIFDARTKDHQVEQEFGIDSERVSSVVGIGLLVVAVGGVVEAAGGVVARSEPRA